MMSLKTHYLLSWLGYIFYLNYPGQLSQISTTLSPSCSCQEENCSQLIGLRQRSHGGLAMFTRASFAMYASDRRSRSSSTVVPRSSGHLLTRSGASVCGGGRSTGRVGYGVVLSSQVTTVRPTCRLQINATDDERCFG